LHRQHVWRSIRGVLGSRSRTRLNRSSQCWAAEAEGTDPRIRCPNGRMAPSRALIRTCANSYVELVALDSRVIFHLNLLGSPSLSEGRLLVFLRARQPKEPSFWSARGYCWSDGLSYRLIRGRRAPDLDAFATSFRGALLCHGPADRGDQPRSLYLMFGLYGISC
jgi:hypothetical protein